MKTSVNTRLNRLETLQEKRLSVWEKTWEDFGAFTYHLWELDGNELPLNGFEANEEAIERLFCDYLKRYNLPLECCDWNADFASVSPECFHLYPHPLSFPPFPLEVTDALLTTVKQDCQQTTLDTPQGYVLRHVYLMLCFARAFTLYK
jgi:hypothetical protein